jgi:3-methylfumaryl-CoA hydratase
VPQVTVDPFPVAALAALFDDGLQAPGPGDPLPPYWHLAACEVPPPTGELGPEGHSHAGPVTPPPGLPRRMFAGGRLRLAGQVLVGDRLDRVTQVIASTDKRGRSGPLRFVTVEDRMARSGGGEALTDEHDIVYRPAAPGPSQPPAGGDSGAADPAMAPGPGSSQGRLLARRGPLRAGFQAGPVALQRFSAATSNAHRIHYDHPYVTRAEGYPGLLVHGTLLLLALLELVRLDLPDRVVGAVSFRAHSPVFAGQEVTLAGEFPARDGTARDGTAQEGTAQEGTAQEGTGQDVVRLTAAHAAGPVAMTCEASFRP